MDLARFAEGLGRPHPKLENLVLFSSIDSTNTFGRRAVALLESEGHRLAPTLISALHQSEGRGRQGRTWSSPPGLGIIVTLVVPVDGSGQLLVLPLLVAVALCKRLNLILGDRCRLKWPNDLTVEGRKIGGILIEVFGRSDVGATAIIGFGVNHGQSREDLPGERATSLRLECRRLPSLPRMTADLVVAVLDGLDLLEEPQRVVERYQALSIHRTGESLRCRAGEGVVEGTFLGFDSRGFLRLESTNGELLLAAGELADDSDRLLAGLGADRRHMSAVDEPSEGAYSYFRAIEETFIRLRGAPLLLSPADYQVVTGWFEAGIPEAFVCRTLEEIFARKTERGEPSSIRSLKYCQRPVEQAWREMRELAAAGVRRAVREIPVAARLQALANALPATLRGRQGIVERILALEGEVERVERQLSDLDRELLDQALARIEEDDRAEMLREAEGGLASLEERLPEAERARLRNHLVRRSLRRKLGLPVLSLFAPEVVEIEDD